MTTPALKNVLKPSDYYHSKNKTPDLGDAMSVLGMKLWVEGILVIFQDRPVFSHII